MPTPTAIRRTVSVYIYALLLLSCESRTGIQTTSESPQESGQVAEAPQSGPTQPSGRPARLEIEGGASQTSASQLRLRFTISEALQMKVSESSDCTGGRWETYSPTKLWSLSQTNALVNLSVIFKDYDEGLSQCAAGRILHDNLPPRIQLSLDSANTYLVESNTSIHFSVKDDGTGLDSLRCALNQNTVPCSSSTTRLDFNRLAQGSHVLLVEATDKLKNKSMQQITWTIREASRRVVQNESVTNQNKIDVVLITDNSGSMEYEQKSMARRMSTFMNKLQGLDYRVGIITTDVVSKSWGDGRLLPLKGLQNQFFLTPSLPVDQAQKVLGDTIQRSETGSDQEQGIFATYRMIERSLDPRDARQHQFLRSDAALAVVVISDEDESAKGPRNSPEGLLSFIQQSYNRKKKFVFHSIITRPGDNRCKQTHGNTFGVTYERLSKLTGSGTVGGAVIGSVCERDYSGQLGGIGQSIQDMRKTIALQCSPIGQGATTVVVNRNGRPYLEKFDLQNNQLVFEKPLEPGNYQLNYLCPL